MATLSGVSFQSAVSRVEVVGGFASDLVITLNQATEVNSVVAWDQQRNAKDATYFHAVCIIGLILFLVV